MAQRPTDMQTNDVIIFMAGHCETRHAKQAGTTKRGCREHAQETSIMIWQIEIANGNKY
jgi:hypothetical protein